MYWPSRWVQMLPVSVWTRKIDLKHAQNEFNCGRCPLVRNSLSLSHFGKWWWWTSVQACSAISSHFSHAWRTTSSARSHAWRATSPHLSHVWCAISSARSRACLATSSALSRACLAISSARSHACRAISSAFSHACRACFAISSAITSALSNACSDIVNSSHVVWFRPHRCFSDSGNDWQTDTNKPQNLLPYRF